MSGSNRILYASVGLLGLLLVAGVGALVWMLEDNARRQRQVLELEGRTQESLREQLEVLRSTDERLAEAWASARRQAIRARRIRGRATTMVARPRRPGRLLRARRRARRRRSRGARPGARSTEAPTAARPTEVQVLPDD